MLTEIATGDPKKSPAWEVVLDLDPDASRVRRMLKDAYVGQADWESLERLYSETGDWAGLAEALSQASEAIEALRAHARLDPDAVLREMDLMGEEGLSVVSGMRRLRGCFARGSNASR